MFFGLQVDRGNLSQAVSDNMLDDLGMNTDGMCIVCGSLREGRPCYYIR